MKKLFSYGTSLILLLGVWWLISFILSIFLPSSSGILPNPLKALIAMIDNWNRISHHFLVSFRRLTLALIASTLIGSSIGLIAGFEDKIESFFSPLIYLTYPIPKVVFLPLFFILLGFNDWARVIFIFSVVVFQVLIGARDAVKNMPQSWIIAVKSCGANKIQLYKHVVIPAALPSIFSSLRVSIGIGIAALYLAESSQTAEGLGAYIKNTWNLFAYPQVFAGILAMGLLGLILYIIIDLLERLFCRWNYIK